MKKVIKVVEFYSLSLLNKFLDENPSAEYLDLKVDFEEQKFYLIVKIEIQL